MREVDDDDDAVEDDDEEPPEDDPEGVEVGGVAAFVAGDPALSGGEGGHGVGSSSVSDKYKSSIAFPPMVWRPSSLTLSSSPSSSSSASPKCTLRITVTGGAAATAIATGDEKAFG